MLAVALLAPWLFVLCFLYWWFPRALPRTTARRLFDVGAIATSLILAVAGALLAQHDRQPALTDELGHRAGDIWPDVLAALYAYSAFSLVLLVALVLRHWLWKRRD